MRKGEWRGAKTRWAGENARRTHKNLQRCCAFHHPRQSNLLTTWFVARQVWYGWWNAQQRYSTRFAAMWQDKLHVACCPFVRPLKGARAILPKVILVWVNMCQRRSFWQDVASTEWPLYIRGPDTNCRWEKEWASLLSLRQRSGLNSNYKGSLKYFSERVVA